MEEAKAALSRKSNQFLELLLQFLAKKMHCLVKCASMFKTKDQQGTIWKMNYPLNRVLKIPYGSRIVFE